MARGECTGWVAGLALSPVTGLLSAARQSRMFHPTGLVCGAEASPVAGTPRAREVAERLAGPVLVRWSSAWWKRGEWMDVLGCALRFTHAPLGVDPKPDDQDLLLATIQRPWSLPFAPWTTHDYDFLANTFFGVSPFEVAPLGLIEWRLTAKHPPDAGGEASRRDRLARRIEAGTATLLLEWARYPGPLKKPIAGQFKPLLEIQLKEFIELDQKALRFHPFRQGRGVAPVGFVHALRRATYRTSQALRPSGGR